MSRRKRRGEAAPRECRVCGVELPATGYVRTDYVEGRWMHWCAQCTAALRDAFGEVGE